MPAVSLSTNVSSCAGILAILDEPEENLKTLALDQLVRSVDIYWPEIADRIPQLEALYESNAFHHKDVVCLLIAKVYYYLGEYDESLRFALESGSLFDIEENSIFTNTILARAIDQYVQARKISTEDSCNVQEINPKLAALLDNLFQVSLKNGAFQRSIGLAVECSRFDLCQRILAECPVDSKLDLVYYTKTVAVNTVKSLKFRNEVIRFFINSVKIIRLLVKTAESMREIDHFFVFDCLVLVKDTNEFVSKINKMHQNEQLKSIVVQVCFDLYENASQEFRSSIVAVMESLPSLKGLTSIVSGEVSTKLNLEFLCRNNNSDLLILENSKNALGTSQSHFISAIAFSNGILHAGTTCDEFLRKNIDYLKHAINWAKFNSSSCIGMIHRGNNENAFKILNDYLPAESSSNSNSNASPYSEGGALFGLGLIFANQSNSKVISYLGDAVKIQKKDPVLHGACLGLGTAAMATLDKAQSESLFSVLFADNAITGEAAAIAIGLVFMGSGNGNDVDNGGVYANLRSYCQETQHEKIKRGIALGISLLFYSQKERADPFIEELCGESDFILRYSAMYSIALAYAGTGNNNAIKKLYHFAVDDSSDEVRRAACVAIGFVLLNEPQKVPGVVKLLAQSFNPHIRYGCAFAIGISCAGKANEEIISILEPLLKDKIDFVRQGALIAIALVFQQCCQNIQPRVSSFREDLARIISNKYEDTLVKFGAVIAQGLIDAGGRNVVTTLTSTSSALNAPGIAGMMLFSHLWHWHPLVPFVSLAFKPLSFVGITSDLCVPKEISIQCKNSSSLFSYPPPLKQAEDTEKETLVTAVLSTTHKTMARAKKLGKPASIPSEKESKPMEVDSTLSQKEKPAEIVPDLFLIPNVSRVTLEQERFVSFSSQGRFKPVCDKFKIGINVFIDSKAGTSFESIEFVSKQQQKDKEATSEAAAVAKAISTESAPPQPFELED